MIILILGLFFIMSMDSCTVQRQVIDHSFTFLDKWGMTTGYEIQYTLKSRASMENEKKERLFFETKKIASAYGREIVLSDFYFKRDSIENQLINDIIEQMRKNQVEVKEVKIVNLLLPKQIMETLIQKATISQTSQPTRVRSIDK
jgi:hypothetical protein